LYTRPITPDDLTPEGITVRLRAAEKRKAAALAEYEMASAEVTWLKEGLRIFDPHAEPKEQDAEAIVTELFPDGAVFGNGLEPTLRQAMVIVMREYSGRQWTVSDLAQALESKGWLPDNGAKRISDMAGEMVRDGQAKRPGRGLYMLSPEVAAALETAPGTKE
jgi:hypothetical protein